MTDHVNDFDQAERIRKLQARRAASRRAPVPAAAESTPPAGAREPADAAVSRAASARSTGRSRRRHPAAASRWLLGGLSVASFFAIAGTVANANASSVAAPASTNATSTAPTAPSTAGATPATNATSATTHANRVPHTTTRGS